MIAIIPSSLKNAIKAEAHDIEITPSWLSPLTSMNVRYAIDSHSADHNILVFRTKDAMAAISARSIAKKKPKITMRVLPNSKIPKSVPSDVRLGVDKWIFPTERMRNLYPSGLKDTIIEAPIDTAFSGKPIADKSARQYIWIGEINNNTVRLKKAIEWIDSQTEEYALTIFGTGKAQYTMPAVRLARSIVHPDRISWMGQPFSEQDCNAPISGVLQAGLDPTPLENRLALDGITLIADY